jgi:hypothetical protein
VLISIILAALAEVVLVVLFTPGDPTEAYIVLRAEE